MARRNCGENAEDGVPLLDRQPTREEVLAELERLRTGYGMSVERLRTEAPAIQSLDATTDEMARRQPAKVQRELAAYDVVRCAVDHLVSRTDLHLILRSTLNITGANSNLTNRTSDLAELVFGGVSSDTIERRFSEAYGSLASILVSLSESPCRENVQRVHRSESVNAAMLIDAIGMATIALNSLTLESRISEREVIAQAIMDRLPMAASVAAQGYDAEAVGQEVEALDLLRDILRSVASWLERAGRRSAVFDEVERWIFSSDGHGTQRLVFAKYEWRRIFGRGAHEFEAYRHVALLFVAESLIGYERSLRADGDDAGAHMSDSTQLLPYPDDDEIIAVVGDELFTDLEAEFWRLITGLEEDYDD